MENLTLANIGALCFGLVIGWITYRSLRRTSTTGLSDIATVIGAVGGGAVTALFASADLFGAYSIGLAIGFFAFFTIFLFLHGKEDKKVKTGQLMGDPIGEQSPSPPRRKGRQLDR